MVELAENATPLSPDELLASGWSARGRNGRISIMVSMFPSIKHPGYVHFAIVATGGVGGMETKRPVRADGLWLFLGNELEKLGFVAGQLSWDRVEAKRYEPRAREIGVVYFLQAGPFIKIGRSQALDRRINDLQTACPYQIDYIGSIVGGAKEETMLHRRFAHLRSSGEWFHATPALVDHVNSLLGAKVSDEN